MGKANEVVTSLIDAVSAAFQVTPNDNAPEGAEVLGGVMYKGEWGDKGDAEKARVGFQAVINGVAGEVKPGFGPAINAALTVNNVPPANYDKPAKWTDIHKPNKAVEPETMDELAELDAEQAKRFEKAYKTLETAKGKDDKAGLAKRQAALGLAAKVVEIRDPMDKGEFARFKKLAPESLKGFIGKNAFGEHYRAGLLAAEASVNGVDFDACLPDGVTGAKGICTAYGVALGAIAENAIAASGKKVDRATVAEGIRKQDPASWTDYPSDVVAMAKLVLPAHLESLSDKSLVVFAEDDGVWKVTKDESGSYVAVSKFGSEGPDELLTAVCKALNNKAEKAEEDAAANSLEDATGAMEDHAKETKVPFADWSEDDVARHLANTLLAQYDGTDERNTKCRRVAVMVAALVNEVVAGNIARGDVLNETAGVDALTAAYDSVS